MYFGKKHFNASVTAGVPWNTADIDALLNTINELLLSSLLGLKSAYAIKVNGSSLHIILKSIVWPKNLYYFSEA